MAQPSSMETLSMLTTLANFNLPVRSLTLTLEEILSISLLEKAVLFVLGTKDSLDLPKDPELRLLHHHNLLMVIEISEMVEFHHSQLSYSLLSSQVLTIHQS